MMQTRRRAALAIAAGAVGCALTLSRQNARAATDALGGLREDLAALEGQSGGRLGVAVLHTGSGGFVGHRADERFPMCSTFKLLAAAAVLKRVDEGKEKLDRRVNFTTSDIVVYSPVTKERVGGEGMTVGELCAAAMTVSDNTAGNLILASLGGPQALNDYARSLGDTVTRLDRIEPDLNEALPDDPRDTTTPAAMLKNIQALILGDALSGRSKQQLISWLVGNKTGDTRVRAGLPAGWRVGDKTGSGERGTTNDVGVAWPPQSAPVLMAVYLTGATANAEARNRTVAAVGSAVADRLSERK
jgi:beta-lactamase class A